LKLRVQVGETVVFPAFGGTKMTIEGEEYVVMKESDLLATIEKEIKIALNKEHLDDLLEDSQKSLEKETIVKQKKNYKPVLTKSTRQFQ